MHQLSFKELRMIALICYEANNRFGTMHAEDLGSIARWGEIGGTVQDRIISGVEYVLAHPAITPEQLHEEWVRYMQDKGWVYGEVKDSAKKAHPCIRPYTELPACQRAKDILFIGIVNAMRDARKLVCPEPSLSEPSLF